MDVLTWINTVVLALIVVFGWLKLAHGDANSACCASALLVMACGLAALGLAVWGAGLVFGWW